MMSKLLDVVLEVLSVITEQPVIIILLPQTMESINFIDYRLHDNFEDKMFLNATTKCRLVFNAIPTKFSGKYYLSYFNIMQLYKIFFINLI